MYICNNGHEQIVYNENGHAKICPLCDALQERDDAIQQLEQYEKEIVHLEGKIELLELASGSVLED